MQKLIMPFKKQMMLCGYKTEEYKKYWGYAHYGIDVSTIQGKAGDDHTIYASGDGVVVLAGKDNKLGYALCVLYPDAYNRQNGRSSDVIARYMHMKSIMVKTGDTIRRGAPLGVEGKEGTGDYHLHLEFDTDVNYPAYTPQVAGSNFWKKGVDTTINPTYMLHVATDQEVVKPTYNPAWLNSEDFNIPKISLTSSELVSNFKPKYKVGDVVELAEGKIYSASNRFSVGRKTDGGLVKIIKILPNATHPYHCRAVNQDGSFRSGAYGWANESSLSPAWEPAVGDKVYYNGNIHYTSADSINGSLCKEGEAIISQIYRLGKSKHPYLLIKTTGSKATVHGWVDEGTFTKIK